MRNREPHIPLFLWVATAALAHILWGGGADRIASIFEDQTSLARLAASVRRHVDSSNRRELEISWEDDAVPEMRPEEATRDPDEDQLEQEPDEPDPEAKSELTKDQQKTPEPPKPEEKPKPKTEKQEQEPAPKPDPEKTKPEPEKKPAVVQPPPPPVNVQRRISVKQHVADKDQPDNPDAKYQADEANRVPLETQSRITSNDQDDPNPTPGLSHLSPEQKAGNAHVNDIAQSESSPGNPDNAPPNSAKDGKDQTEQARAQAPTPKDPSAAVFGDQAAGGKNKPSAVAGATPPKPTEGQTAQKEQDARDAIAEVRAAEGESATRVAAAQEARAASKGRKAATAIPMLPRGSSGANNPYNRFGLTPGGLNPNLTPLAALETVGADQLHRERLADGERRRSTHRGSWQAVGLERWRSAIENYVPTAREGTTTALNTARVPFASYLNQIHNRLHPIFADRFLASLDSLPSDHPANRSGISTNLEIVLNPADGRIVRMGVTKASGTTVFDVNALEAVQRASPFGAAPNAIVSPDGNVYLHWEFHREPNLACSTYFARPKMLRVAPQTAPPIIPLRPPATPQEHGQNQNRPPSEQSGG